jgi:hypothetical protein
MSKSCPRCGLETDDAAAFCRGCGVDLRSGAGKGVRPVESTSSDERFMPPRELPPDPGTVYAYAGGELPASIPTHLIWALLATIICCNPIGIVSIVYAAQVNTLLFRGDIPGAQRASRLARNWTIVTVAVSVIGWIVFASLLTLGGLHALRLFHR